jgi:hypothetical protein
VATAEHDYTRDGTDGVPFDSDPADYRIGDVQAPEDRDADKIERENGFRTIPPGRHVLVVRGFRDQPEEKYYPVMLSGRQSGFTAAQVKVRLSLPNDPRATIEDIFLLPPADPREHAAYWHGVPDGQNQGGFQANKFLHFIERLGFPFPAGGRLHPDGQHLRNWIDRPIVAEVKDGDYYKDSEGNSKKGFNKVKLFSYERHVPGTATRSPAGAGPTAQRASAPTAQGMEAPSAAAAARERVLKNI